MDIKRAIRYWIIRVKRLNGDPHYVAAGMATGIFVGITPTIPFHTALAIAIAFLLRGSKVAAVLGVWCGNPLTIPFFYYWSYKIGVFVMGDPNHYNLKAFNFLELWQNGHDVAIKMLLGGAILAVLPAVVSYMITLRIMIIRKRQKQKRLARETTT